MSRRHPIDQIFGRRLEHHVSPVPVNLWAKIDKKRNWKYKLRNQVRLHQSKILLISVAVMMLVGGLLLSPSNIELGSFPIPMKGKIISPQKPTIQAFNAITKPVVENISSIKAKSFSTINTQKASPKKTISKELISHGKTNGLPQNLNLIPTSETRITKANHLHNFSLLQPKSFIPKPVLNSAPISFNFLSDDPVCATFGHGRWHFYASALVSPDLIFRKLESKTSESDSYVQSRETTESQRISYSAGVNITAVSGFGLSVRTGLNYSQINEQFEYVNEREETIEIKNRFDPITGEVIGTDTTVVIGTRIKSTSNRYQSLDIPLLLGYELHHNEKFSFAVNAGVSVNIVSRQKGDFLSPTDLRPVSFSSNTPGAIPAFKDQIGLSYYGSLGAYYKLNPKLQIAAEPYFKLNPSSISQESYVVDQKYLSVGLWMGIRMKL